MSLPTSPEKTVIISPDLNGDGGNKCTVPLSGENVDTVQPECRVYKFRWVVLILFVVYSMSNAFQVGFKK